MTNNLLRKWFQLLTLPLNLNLNLHKSEPEITFLLLTGASRPVSHLPVCSHLWYQFSFYLHSTRSNSNPAQFQFTKNTSVLSLQLSNKL